MKPMRVQSYNHVTAITCVLSFIIMFHSSTFVCVCCVALYLACSYIFRFFSLFWMLLHTVKYMITYTLYTLYSLVFNFIQLSTQKINLIPCRFYFPPSFISRVNWDSGNNSSVTQISKFPWKRNAIYKKDTITWLYLLHLCITITVCITFVNIMFFCSISRLF